jgi:hypothetical protein
MLRYVFKPLIRVIRCAFCTMQDSQVHINPVRSALSQPLIRREIIVEMDLPFATDAYRS